ncbi:uncharacterized protein B0T15DRAFT_109872 [Chaetomium strumarium]|uniref:Uncharacterized protein n=1 Tax=Chaetomium strumarium TaxID=1170767 RepID=A0AAJ0GZ38_9PEZI|nr:hypothetical protein B0T15DRAFT_109872 [Chaetomium strumarium]
MQLLLPQVARVTLMHPTLPLSIELQLSLALARLTVCLNTKLPTARSAQLGSTQHNTCSNTRRYSARTAQTSLSASQGRFSFLLLLSSATRPPRYIQSYP